MRERLIELLKEADEHSIRRCITDYGEAVADNAEHLLENGVIVPPCKVGAVVFRITEMYNAGKAVIEGEVFEVAVTQPYRQKTEYRFYFYAKGEDFVRRQFSIWCRFDEFGKTVFLTREEAEAALKERENHG